MVKIGMRSTALRKLPSSFRDPAGYVFVSGGEVLRAVTARGLEDYEHFKRCGLAASLARDQLLLPFEETQGFAGVLHEVPVVLRPQQLRFVSYPYEWCFSQLKDAALLTLEVQRRALDSGMRLKDASAFNIQFHNGHPVFIDTLSFERDDGGPWVAYEQFCRQFLAPLLLMKTISQDVGRMMSADLGGIPLRTASRLLGWRSYFSAGALLHVHLHAQAVDRASRDGGAAKPAVRVGDSARIVDSLRRAVSAMNTEGRDSSWSGYVNQAGHYPADAAEAKARFVQQTLHQTPTGLVFDIGGNTGQFSRMAAAAGHCCILFDSDVECVERAYRGCRQSGEERILPLRMDVSNPTPALGVNLRERMSLFERPRADLVMALALVHHLRLKENIPFGMMAEFISRLGGRLLVEWVGPEDEMARAMLRAKRTPPDDYTVEAFLGAFAPHFRLARHVPVPGMDRSLMVMECTESSNS